jgi:hypothetical protein
MLGPSAMTVIDVAGAVFFRAELRVGPATMLNRERRSPTLPQHTPLI